MSKNTFEPCFVINGVYNAILRRHFDSATGIFNKGTLVRAQRFVRTDGRVVWAIDRPPVAASVFVDGCDLVSITSVTKQGE